MCASSSEPRVGEERKRLRQQKRGRTEEDGELTDHFTRGKGGGHYED